MHGYVYHRALTVNHFVTYSVHTSMNAILQRMKRQMMKNGNEFSPKMLHS